MPSYEYRCPEGDVVERFYPMGAAPSAETCPRCHANAKRVYSAPLLSRTPRHLTSVLENAEKSREQPDVVRRDPEDSRKHRRNPVSPALEKLVGKEAAPRLRSAPQMVGPH